MCFVPFEKQAESLHRGADRTVLISTAAERLVETHYTNNYTSHAADCIIGRFVKVSFDADKKIARHKSLRILNLQTQAKTCKMPSSEFQRKHKTDATYFKRTIMCWAVFAVSGHFMKYDC